jgi:hypothetical protein
LLPLSVVAQQNELSLTLGGNFTVSPQGNPTCEAILTCPTGPVSVGIAPGFAIAGSYARRVADFKAAALYAEFPIVATPVRSGVGIFSSDFASIFFTPSLRLQLAPARSVSPFFSVGAGLAYYNGSGTDTRWAAQFGGGLDFKTRLPHLGFRVEARDFFTGKPSIANLINVTSGHLQQVYAGGGVVIKF